MQLRHAKAIVKRNEEAARLVVEAGAAEVAEAEAKAKTEALKEPEAPKSREPVD